MNTIRLVPDASVALAWLLYRVDVHESLLAQHLLDVAHGSQNTVPHIWRVEVANGVLRAERSQRIRGLRSLRSISFSTICPSPPTTTMRHPASRVPASLRAPMD
jgi:hypothetical protein